jgi:hypothetical protein
VCLKFSQLKIFAPARIPSFSLRPLLNRYNRPCREILRAALMPAPHGSKSAIDAERKILRALCATEIDSADWLRFLRRLALHAWTAPEHRVVFEALRAIRSQDPTARREQLPAQATRMGFPDVDWENYFGVRPSDCAEIEKLVGNLEVSTKSRQPGPDG